MEKFVCSNQIHHFFKLPLINESTNEEANDSSRIGFYKFTTTLLNFYFLYIGIEMYGGVVFENCVFGFTKTFIVPRRIGLTFSLYL